MAITKISNSAIDNGTKYISFLAGNDAYDPGAFVPIASATGTGSNFEITFTSIPSTYSHLQIRIIANASYAISSAITGSFQMTFNSDTASNYAYHNLTADGTTVSAAGLVSQSSIQFNTLPFGSAFSGIYGANIIDIHDYAATTRNKTMRGIGGADANGSGNLRIFSGLWMSTNAITSLKISAANVVTFNTPTTFALYGIKGA